LWRVATLHQLVEALLPGIYLNSQAIPVWGAEIRLAFVLDAA
jgi:hypothetical protein